VIRAHDTKGPLLSICVQNRPSEGETESLHDPRGPTGLTACIHITDCTERLDTKFVTSPPYDAIRGRSPRDDCVILPWARIEETCESTLRESPPLGLKVEEMRSS